MCVFQPPSADETSTKACVAALVEVQLNAFGYDCILVVGLVQTLRRETRRHRTIEKYVSVASHFGVIGRL